MPPDATRPRLFLPVSIRIGRPISVARYEGRADDRLALRQIIDELMFEIRALSGQTYVDSYATRSDNALVVAPKATLHEAEPLKPVTSDDTMVAAAG